MMERETPEGLLRALEACLDTERLHLRDGNFDGLNAGLAEKARLLEALARQGLSPGRADVARIGQKSRRNETLLGEAARGLNAAILRISELRRVLSGADTYRADGSRSCGAPTTGRLHKRT